MARSGDDLMEKALEEAKCEVAQLTGAMEQLIVQLPILDQISFAKGLITMNGSGSQRLLTGVLDRAAENIKAASSASAPSP